MAVFGCGDGGVRLSTSIIAVTEVEGIDGGLVGVVWVGRDAGVGDMDCCWDHTGEVEGGRGADVGDMDGVGCHTGEVGGVEDSGWEEDEGNGGDDKVVCDPLVCKKISQL